MGCCSSKDVCDAIYVEMRRRLGVEPTIRTDAVSAAKRTVEFEEMISRNTGCNSSTEKCVAVGQLRLYDRKHWRMSSVHPYNDLLLADVVEDVARHRNVASGGCSAELRRCDYRPWLLCMCEFYRVMLVFEKAKLLNSGGWEKTVLTENGLSKCLPALTSEFASAFASNQGPGSVFEPPSSASAATVLQQALEWSINPLNAGKGGGDAAARSVLLATFVRWLTLRYVCTLLNDEDAVPREATPKRSSRAASADDEKGDPTETRPLWGDVFLQKQNMLRCALSDRSQLEKLFDSMTHGTRLLSEAGAMAGCYHHFSMADLFEDKSVHDALVSVAFRGVVQEEITQDDEDTACICSLPVFSRFLEAYTEVLQLYYHAVMQEAALHGTEPTLGMPAPDLEREALTRLLESMKGEKDENNSSEKENSDNDCSELADQFLSSLGTGKGDARQVPFLPLADAWVTQLLLSGDKPEVKDISELYEALGLGSDIRKEAIMSLLVDNGWNANEAERTFNAMQADVGLPQYCTAQELACACARQQWLAECEERKPAAVDDADGRSTPNEGNETIRILENIHLMRLLHGVYGIFAAVRVLETISLEEGCTPSMKSDASKWDTTTLLPGHVRALVLREAGATLGVPSLTADSENGAPGGREVTGPTTSAEGTVVGVATAEEENKDALCVTAARLLQHISRRYVEEKMMGWRRDAWERLRAAWPLSDEDQRHDVFFQALTREGEREVRAEAEGTDDSAPCPPFDELYEQYASDLLFLLPQEEFRAVCRNAVRAVVDTTDACFTADEVPAFLRYTMGYLQVMLALGVPHDPSARDTTAKVSWEELQAWLLREAKIMLNEPLRAAFAKCAGTDSNGVAVKDVAEWFGLREARKGSLETRLRVWLRQIRAHLPIRYTAADRKTRKKITDTISAADDYITTEALTEFLSLHYGLCRVWPRGMGSKFVMFAVHATNKILLREDLQGSELHRSDLRFLLIFIYTYLDVFLHGECLEEKAAETLECEEETPTSPVPLLCVSWADSKMRLALCSLLKGRGMDEELLLSHVLCDAAGHNDQDDDDDKNNNDNMKLFTVADVANTVAREAVAAALQRYLDKCAAAAAKHHSDSMWDLLRQRLPIGKTEAQRLQRQRLFSSIDLQGRHLLTLCDLHRGMFDILKLYDFREDLSPVLFRAFFATKEVSSSAQNTVYLLLDGEQFITAAEFRAFLWYVYTYFELYYMFDTLCTSAESQLNKTVSVEAFADAAPLLKRWGVRINDAADMFASINRKCKEGDPMNFIGFATWASLHHLTPSGYSHEEPMDDDSDEDDDVIAAVEEAREGEGRIQNQENEGVYTKQATDGAAQLAV
ncbi:flagellar calcium-binding protein [Trypanosoma grayi]|uniref:flagellar calcium-binding protein n=1 Tax=Trypanosoma grayi TaxID=71804 RepID=UPI0004F4A359|nr:flagellar calcium-binding protein [Trypanosoma grayi]KEG08380.1 flagellar calcium-binding protein [Trypanosoma grayi]